MDPNEFKNASAVARALRITTIEGAGHAAARQRLLDPAFEQTAPLDHSGWTVNPTSRGG